jgi:hypothetical protein
MICYASRGILLHEIRKYDKQDPHTIQQQEPVARNPGGPQTGQGRAWAG